MHVHWKRKAPGRLTAYLVKSVRANGKSRHRTVAYIGGVNNWFLQESESKNELRSTAALLQLNEFWDRAGGKLREIEDVDPRVWDSLETRIPPISFDEADKIRRLQEVVHRRISWAVYRELLKEPALKIKAIVQNDALERLKGDEPDLAHKIAAALKATS